MKIDQRSVQAAWRCAAEAWLSDQARVEFMLTPRVLHFKTRPQPHQLTVRTMEHLFWLQLYRALFAILLAPTQNSILFKE